MIINFSAVRQFKIESIDVFQIEKYFQTLAISFLNRRLTIWVVMMMSSNGSIFRVTGALCGEFTGHRWIPLTKASDAELWCFLWPVRWWMLSKQSWGWWFETPSSSLWPHCNGYLIASHHSFVDSCSGGNCDRRYFTEQVLWEFFQPKTTYFTQNEFLLARLW